MSVATATSGPASAVANPPAWKMPKPKFGLVMWSNSDNSGKPCVAIVTQVWESMINVIIFPGGNVLGHPEQGCKHVSDPSLKRMVGTNPGGVWDFLPGETELRGALEDAVATIERLTEELARARMGPYDEDEDETTG